MEKHNDAEWLTEKYKSGFTEYEIADLCSVSRSTIQRRLDSLDIDKRGPGGVEKSPHWDEDWLRDKYHEEGLSCAEIGGLVGVDESNIRHHMDKHGIERRDSPSQMDGVWRNKWLLRHFYKNMGLSTTELAEKLGCSQQTVHRWLQRHGIETRHRGGGNDNMEALRDADHLRELHHSEGLSTAEIAGKYNCYRSTVNYWFRRHGIEYNQSRRMPEELDDAGWLRQKHHNEDLTMVEIAEELDVGSTTVRIRMLKNDVDLKPSVRERTGADSPHWEGGVSDDYGPDWQNARERRIQADKEECVACGMSREEHRETHGKDLCVHHIKPRRAFIDEVGEVPAEANESENLVTLCIPCHQEVEHGQMQSIDGAGVADD